MFPTTIIYQVQSIFGGGLSTYCPLIVVSFTVCPKLLFFIKKFFFRFFNTLLLEIIFFKIKNILIHLKQKKNILNKKFPCSEWLCMNSSSFTNWSRLLCSLTVEVVSQPQRDRRQPNDKKNPWLVGQWQNHPFLSSYLTIDCFVLNTKTNGAVIITVSHACS